MDAEKALFLSIFAIPLIGLVVYGIVNRPKILSGPAVVESHRVQYGKTATMWSRNYNCLVTFRFSDGDTLELHVTQEEYEILEDGQHGMVFWDGDRLMEFIPD